MYYILATHWNLLSLTRRHNSWILRARHAHRRHSFVRPSVRKLWEMNSYNDARHTPICFRWSYCQNCKQTCTRHPIITRNKFFVCFSLGRLVAAAVHHIQHVWIIIASHEIPICEWEFYFIFKILLLKNHYNNYHM